MTAIPFSTWEIQPGVHLHVAPTEKFKTVRIRGALRAPLHKETATANALIPLVLRRGSKSFPTLREMSRHLESLYGAAFGVSTRKIGESQLMETQLHVSSERFLPAATGLLAESIDFLSDTLLNPVTTAGGFQPDYVRTERETLRQRIDGLVDERFQYAVERCYANMCADEPFGTYRYGRSADLDAIDPHNLFERYTEYMRESEVDIVVVGAVQPDEVHELLAKRFVRPRRAIAPTPAPERVHPSDVKTVIERMDVLQGVLVLGCRLPVTYTDELYPALLMYNGILGGFSHSKLFTEVRERASLAYTAFSRMETVKGVQILFAGIDVNKFEAARDIMLQQLDAVKQGQVTEQELDSTRKAMVNGLLSGLDEAGSIIQSRLFGAVAGRYRDVHETVEAIENVTLNQIVQVAQGVALDTIYFLRDHGAKGA